MGTLDDLVDVTGLLLREKKVILRSVVAAFVLTAIIVFLLMKPMYTAEAVFLPPQTSPGGSMAQLASQLSSLGAVGALSGLKNTGDIYAGILSSRTIADHLIQRFQLQKVYSIKKLSDTEKKLKRRTSIISNKDTLITIRVEDHDPKRAADMANSYLDQLREQNGRLALTEAAQRRLFFGQQLEREKNALADAEVELRRTQEQTGMIAPYGQAQVEIQTIAQLRAEIASSQVELAGLKQSATDQNPAVVRLQAQIAGWEAQLKKLQSGVARRSPGDIQLPTTKLPEFSLEYIRKQREVKYHELLFESLAKQYESARLEESRDAPVLQVIDRAVVPDKKSGPPRALFLAASCILGAIFGITWVILKVFYQKAWARLNQNNSVQISL
ncbi:MAG: hypothetical protein BGO25_12240 [Acidobacteriales bacterium 59-55]|nr:MAG: hypothetical protein BGO25_12240 [Acidobacteriales bacterium 59-55]